MKSIFAILRSVDINLKGNNNNLGLKKWPKISELSKKIINYQPNATNLLPKYFDCFFFKSQIFL